MTFQDGKYAHPITPDPRTELPAEIQYGSTKLSLIPNPELHGSYCRVAIRVSGEFDTSSTSMRDCLRRVAPNLTLSQDAGHIYLSSRTRQRDGRDLVMAGKKFLAEVLKSEAAAQTAKKRKPQVPSGMSPDDFLDNMRERRERLRASRNRTQTVPAN